MKKRKFRAMTIGEHCFGSRPWCKGCEYRQGHCFCGYGFYNQVDMVRNKDKPFKTKDGKYILIEVEE